MTELTVVEVMLVQLWPLNSQESCRGEPLAPAPPKSKKYPSLASYVNDDEKRGAGKVSSAEVRLTHDRLMALGAAQAHGDRASDRWQA